MFNLCINKPKSEQRKKHSKIPIIISIILILSGILVLLYPSVGNVISYFQQRGIVDEYERTIAEMTKSDNSAQKKIAAQYNDSLGQIAVQDPFSTERKIESVDPKQDSDDYYTALNIGQQNIMGYIKIPKISISIPIYHDATEVQLQKGICHLKGTSLPIGGLGTHCVLTGHTGVPGNMLFTDIDKLEIGDRFYLHILDDVLAYEIDQIKVVEPSDTRELRIDRQQDYCTLVTCTPYGINSHRLLVRGVRTQYTQGEDDYESSTVVITDEDGNTVIRHVADAGNKVNVFGVSVSKMLMRLIIRVGLLCVVITAIVIVIKRKKSKNSEKCIGDSNEKS